LNCHRCSSDDLVFVESKLDDSVVGGKVHIYRCNDCGAMNEDLPSEVADARCDRQMTNEAESR
jgi:hypothetical protein